MHRTWRGRGASGGGGGGGGFYDDGSGLTHYGTATLPTSLPTFVPGNTFGSGTTHTPATPTALNTLLTGGSLAAGDVIVLTDNTCYNSVSFPQHKLPVVIGASKSNPVWVVTSNVARLPAAAYRVTDSHKLTTPHFRMFANNTPCVKIPWDSDGWVFVGIEFDCGSTTNNYACVTVGQQVDGAYSSGTTYGIGDIVYDSNGTWYSKVAGNVGHDPATSPTQWRANTLADLPTGIAFDRCRITSAYGNNTSSSLVNLACGEVTFTGCHIWSEGGAGLEDKAVGGVTVAGPIRMYNNTVVAAAINMLLGGATPMFDVTPAQMSFVRNWFYKPLRYNTNDASWDSNSRIIKNLFELKVGKYVDVRDNLFENHWDGGTSQYYSVVFKVSNGTDTPGQQGYDAAETGHITFRYNKLKGVGGVFGLGAMDVYNLGPDLTPVHDLSIYHNYTSTPHGINSAASARTWAIQASNATNNLINNWHFEHNTFVSDYDRVDVHAFVMAGNRSTMTGFKWRNNISDYGGSGFTTDHGGSVGTDQFAGTSSDANGSYLFVKTGVTPTSGKYGSPFTTSTTASDFFVNRAGGDYTTAASLNNAGYNSETPGAAVATVDTHTTGCTTGVW